MNKKKVKAPIIIMMVCFFLFTHQSFNVQAAISDNVTKQEISSAKACTLVIDANKHIGERKIFAEAKGICNGQVQGYYLKASDSFNITGAVNEFVNFNGEKFDFLIEPSGSLSVVTVKLIEPIKSTIHTKKRKSNLRNYKKKHQTDFDINEYLEENQKATVKQDKEEAIRSSDQVAIKNKSDKKVIVEKKKERNNKSGLSFISIFTDLIIILAIITLLYASYYYFRKLKIHKGE